MKIRRWIHARIVRRNFWDCSCDICYFHWSVFGDIRTAFASTIGHARDWHGGVDRHD